MALSVKTREHIRRWAALAGPKWGALLGGAAALAAAITFTGSALHFTTVADTHGDTVRILTAATDLAAVLQQSGTPPLGEHDEAVWSQTEDGERLDVLRAYTVSVTADGAMQELTVTGTHTTAELLERAGLTYTADDLLTPAADEIVPEGSGITVQRVTYNEYTVDEVVPTEIEEIPTSLFYRKQSKVMTLEEGHDGQDTVVYREKWIDGEWAETNEIERVNEAEMVPTVQKIYGEQGSRFRLCRAGCGRWRTRRGRRRNLYGAACHGLFRLRHGQGASGRRLTYGTVAINPGVIPYGSLLYITSDDGKFVYGYAYAADTGTALVQGKAFIDLYYETYEESVENAVIPVTVYVLDDETAARYKEQNDAILEADTVVGR